MQEQHGFKSLVEVQSLQEQSGIYRLWMINFGWFMEKTFATLEQAKAYAVEKGFEVSIYNAKQMVASWSPIGGYKEFQ